MLILGCDFHTRYQQIAMVDNFTGELTERRLEHESGQADTFYRGLPKPVRVGIEATGHAVAVVSGCQSCWYRGEVFAGSRHLATYANSTTFFVNSDWLGTERARTDINGSIFETCQSLPYGDGLSCSGTDFSPLHFTGKERDEESNLDNFGARPDALTDTGRSALSESDRYYTSTMGRWMTPDWSARGEAVPYAVLTNPQSLNLYAYVLDNPTTSLDPDGHNNGPGHDETPPNGCGGANQPACQQSSAQVAANQTNDPQAQQQSTDPNNQIQHRTLVGAGIGAERKYNPTSIKQDKEYAGWIEKTKNGKYVVDPANPGTQAGSEPGPRPKHAAAEYHTHGANDPGYDNEHFSPQDKLFLRQNHVPGFLGTPGHTIQEYDPATGRVIIFKERTD